MTFPELTGSRLDDWWGRIMARPAAHTAWRWGGPAVVTAVAAWARLEGLANPHELVFDETYYVKDSWAILHLGYEASWPEDANDQFQAGDPDTYDPNSPAFVAHPPLGKWIMALGLAAVGAQSSVGWRISVAVCGILLVVATMVLAHLLFRSTVITTFAGFLLAIDGSAIVMSRVSLLDTVLALLCLVGVIFTLLDRFWAERRLRRWVDAHPFGNPWGPAMWARPWLIAAGLTFGLAAGVKWSGGYFLVAFGVYTVVSELWLRKQAGVEFWASGAVLKQGPVNFVLAVPIAIAAYIATWSGWFVTEGGYYRQWIQQDSGLPGTGVFAWIPPVVQDWWHYQQEMYNFNINEHASHPYAANPLTWLVMSRPTSMYWNDFHDGTVATILDIANPLIWWSGAVALVALVVIVIRRLLRREKAWREVFVLMGIVGGYLPWLLYTDRTVFWFYVIAFEPYLVLALAACARIVLGRATDPASQRGRGINLVIGYSVAALALSAFFFPIWTAERIPTWFMYAHFWFPSWI